MEWRISESETNRIPPAEESSEDELMEEETDEDSDEDSCISLTDGSIFFSTNEDHLLRLGRSVALSEVYFILFEDMNEDEITPIALKAVEKGFRKNKSIGLMSISGCDFSSGALFEALLPFCKNPQDRDAPGETGDEEDLENWIYLSSNSISDKAMKNISKALAKQAHLDYLRFCQNDITSRGWKHFFDSLKSPQMSLRKLCIEEGCHLDDQKITLFSVGLAKNKSLREIHISSTGKRVTDVGWAAFGYALTKSNVEDLELNDNDLDGDKISALASSWDNSRAPYGLYFDRNLNISGRGVRVLSRLLEKSHQKIEALHLGEMTGDDIISLTNSLKHNSALKKNSMGWPTHEPNFAQFIPLLCNASSIDSTYHSNHTLEAIINRSYQLPLGVAHWLELNCNSDKQFVAVKKVFDCHLTGNFKLQQFKNMGTKLLPDVLGWVATPLKNDDVDIVTRFSAFYRLLKSDPALFKALE